MSETYEQQLDRSQRERKRIADWHRERAREVALVSEDGQRLLADAALAVIGAANRPRLAPVEPPAPDDRTSGSGPRPGVDISSERDRQREIARLRKRLDPDTLRVVDRALEAHRVARADADRRRDRRLRRSTVARRTA